MEESIKIARQITEVFELKENKAGQYSPLTLAFIGDSIYDLIIRTIVVEKGNAPVNKLHKKVSSLVKASAQVEMFRAVEPILNSKEMEIYKRGRNAKSVTSAKNATIAEYRTATGYEALLGYLYLEDNLARILELVKIGLHQKQILGGNESAV